MAIKTLPVVSDFKRKRVIVFEFGNGVDGKPADVEVDDETLRIPLPFDVTFMRWTINGVDPPVGSDGIVDIFKNDVSIFDTDDADKVVLPDGSAILAFGTTFKAKTGIKNSLMYAKILAVGSTTSGKGWLVTLELY